MKKITLFCCASALIFLTGCGNPDSSPKQGNDEKIVGELIEQYIESIEKCDTTIVNHIWSHDAKVSFIAPSGRYSTYEEIRDSLVTGLFGKKFTYRKLQKDNLKICINGNTAWSEFFWTFDAVKNNGMPHRTKGCETQLFEKDKKGVWKLIHIHYSNIK